MKNPVLLKSYPNGIAVWLDEELAFDSLLCLVAEKFQENADFFGDKQVALSFEGRRLNDLEENALVEAITGHSALQVICVAGQDQAAGQLFDQAHRAFARFFPKDEGEGRFYRGNIRKGQILETEGSIVIIGNVEPGGSIISTKDIVVLGRLAGSAYAGGSGTGNHFIAALEMTPQKLKIGDFKYKTKEKSRLLFTKTPALRQPQIARIVDDSIQMQDITNELLNELPM